MKYAYLEEKTNRLIGWYADDIHGIWIEPVYEKDILVKEGFYDISKIPTPNIKASDEEWQKAISINANFYDKKQKKFIFKDFRTSEEIKEQELSDKILNADRYLKDTDWVKDYLLRHELGLDTIAEDSEKWKIIKKREEYKEFLKSL